MKTRIMFYLSLVALFGFTENSLAMEEPPEINTPEEYTETIHRLGTEGTKNTFYGNLAGNTSMSGTYNSFFGRSAGNKNTNGNYNSFFGAFAGHENTTGSNNTFVGTSAGMYNTGYWNTFNGSGAGYSNTTGYWNTCMGFQTGYNNQTGSYNVFLGSKAGYNETGSHKLYIDSTDTATPLIWGDFNTNEVKINGGFKANASSMSSDQRWKKNIQPLESSLHKISNLQGVSYEWKTDEYPDIGLTKGKQIGLVAQDVEKSLPELVSKDKDGYKSVSYTKLTAVLVEAVKELKGENESQKKLIEAQRHQFRKQQSEIEQLRSMIKELKG